MGIICGIAVCPDTARDACRLIGLQVEKLDAGRREDPPAREERNKGEQVAEMNEGGEGARTRRRGGAEIR